MPPAPCRALETRATARLAGRLSLGLALLLLPAVAGGATCGDDVPCQCGDTVAADHRLAAPLGPCPGHGLVVKSGVRLDCRGLRITGLGDGSDQYGIYLDGRRGAEVTGSSVSNCHVSGFRRGIRLRAARGNVIRGNVLTRNGNFTAHEGYGIDVAGGSAENLLEGNRVHRSADEGVHIGRDCHGNRLIGNEITDNHRESLYLLGADRGVYLRNVLGGGGSNSVYVKDSSRNRFEDNRFVGRPVRVIGASRDNIFADNTFSGAGLHFQDYRGGEHPRGNRVTGGAIEGGRDYCVRFTNSAGNVVADAAMSACRVAVRAESPARPTENMVIGLKDAAVELDQRSTLLLGWRAVVRVRDGAGRPVAGAEVLARDRSGGPVWSAVTDADGAIAAQMVVTATRTGSAPARLTGPITVAVSKAGFGRHVEEVTVAGPVDLAITLKPE